MDSSLLISEQVIYRAAHDWYNTTALIPVVHVLGASQLPALVQYTVSGAAGLTPAGFNPVGQLLWLPFDTATQFVDVPMNWSSVPLTAEVQVRDRRPHSGTHRHSATQRHTNDMDIDFTSAARHRRTQNGARGRPSNR